MNIVQTRRRVWRVIPAATAAVVLLGLPTMTASASAGLPRAGHSQILMLSADRTNAVLIPAPGVSKAAYDPNRDARILGISTADQTATATSSTLSFSARPASASAPRPVTSYQTLSASNSIRTCPPGGSCANTSTNFSTSVSWASGIQGTATFAGQSHADWYGCCPYNATNMYLSDTWRVGGVAVSVSFPPGVGISGSGDQANWSRQVGNTWYINHYFNGIQFASYVLVCCASESSTGESQFGSNFYSTTANG